MAKFPILTLGNMDKDNSRVFLMLTKVDGVGGMPIGLFITSTERADTIKQGLKLISKLVGENSSFGGQCYPTAIMTDDSAAEKRAIGEPFIQVILTENN